MAAYFYPSTKNAKGQRPHEFGPTDFLAQRTGIAVTDGDALFAVGKKRDYVIDCGCATCTPAGTP